MTLLWFIVGLALILGIAKYNASNKLFWILLVSYLFGFVGVKLIYDAFGEKKQSTVSLNQAYPTQGLTMMQNAIAFTDVIFSTTLKKETSKPVGQVYTPEYVEPTKTLSNVSGVTQGLYVHVLPNPPNNKWYFNSS